MPAPHAWRAIGLASLLWLALPNASTASEPTPGDAIVVGSIGDASRLLPILASDSASGDIVGLLFNELLKYNERLEIVGDLAESWIVSPDGLTLTFTLRPNIRWHDGQPLTADDVRFTYEKLIDPAVRTPFSSAYELVEADVVIRPNVTKIGTADFNQKYIAILEGEKAALAAIAAIREKISQYEARWLQKAEKTR